MSRYNAASGSIKAGAPASPARGLRRTAVGRAPRATSTPPPAAPPRLASYKGGAVGRASRARLSPPRQPSPLLTGTCLTSAGRPPLRRMLATKGPGYPEEGYPGPKKDCRSILLAALCLHQLRLGLLACGGLWRCRLSATIVNVSASVRDSITCPPFRVSAPTAGCADVDPGISCMHNRLNRLFGGTVCMHHAIRVNRKPHV